MIVEKLETLVKLERVCCSHEKFVISCIFSKKWKKSLEIWPEVKRKKDDLNFLLMSEKFVGKGANILFCSQSMNYK